MSELAEIPLQRDMDATFPAELQRLVEAGKRRSRQINCFDFVSSDPEHIWRSLAALPRAKFCEWGSGIGIMTGIASWLGYQATGIELNEELAAASRQLLVEHELHCDIRQGSYFDIHVEADYYFVYCWPGKQNEVEQHFLVSTPPQARLLICHGAADLRCKVRSRT